MESDNCINKTYTYPREGDNDMIDVRLVMKMLRCGFKSIGGIKVESVLDHCNEAGPEKSSIEYRLDGGSSVDIRTPGFEQKLEVCISIADDSTESASDMEKRIREDLESIIYMDSRMGYCCE